MSGNATYCSLAIVTDISGIRIPVGNANVGDLFNFQIGPSPPPEFFNIRGIYAQRTVSPVNVTFNRLYNQLRTVDISAVDPFNNNDMNIYVQQLSFGQQQYYQQLLSLFQQVYAFNLAAYTLAGQTRKTPIYYTFELASQVTMFREANALVNKLYNVNPYYPLTSLFFLPFPPFCN
jgi:hypothetical protein